MSKQNLARIELGGGVEVSGFYSLSEFDAVARRIGREWDHRHDGSGSGTRRGSPGAIEWLTRAIYEMTEFIFVNDLVELIDDRLRQYDRRSLVGKEGLRLFQASVRSAFAHAPELITASQRDRVAKKAWHAYRHYVPGVFLAGFFRQLPSADLDSRSMAGVIEPEFRNWVVECRAIDRDDECFRGQYPAEIEEAVEGLAADEWPDDDGFQ